LYLVCYRAYYYIGAAISKSTEAKINKDDDIRSMKKTVQNRREIKVR
jgi:hypothetical protein